MVIVELAEGADGLVLVGLKIKAVSESHSDLHKVVVQGALGKARKFGSFKCIVLASVLF